MQPRPILLTRPKRQAHQMLGDLRDIGADRVVLSPLLRIDAAKALPDLPPVLVFTSRNAVATYVELGGPACRVAWCVGPRTAQDAEAAGLIVKGVAPDAETLVDRIVFGRDPILHLRGRVQRGDLAGALRKRGADARDAVIYDQLPQDLTPEARALLSSEVVLVPLFSPRTAKLFGQCCPESALQNVRIIALSPAVAQASPVSASIVAESPDSRAMLDAIGRLIR